MDVFDREPMQLNLRKCVLALGIIALMGCQDHAQKEASTPNGTLPNSDEALVRLYQRDGIGIALRVPGTLVYHAGAPIPLHITLEDIAANVRIADSPCLKLTLNMQDQATGVVTASTLKLPRCLSTADNEVYTAILKRGELKRFDVLSSDAFDFTVKPGRYLISVGWSSYEAGNYSIFTRRQYNAVLSNTIPITVLP